MTYPDTPGFARHSDTSRNAAETLTTAQLYRKALLDALKIAGSEGVTIDEFAKMMDVAPNHVSGRFSELSEKGLICKTPMRRKTRSGKQAVVYLLGSWTDHMATSEPMSRPEPPKSQLGKYKDLQAIYGHGHVIPRNDARKEGCGGPAVCKSCRQVQSYFNYMQQQEKN